MSNTLNLVDYSSSQGLGFEKHSRGMTYLYGLSDFWATTFSDVNTVNLLMEASAFEASEIYNKFLQLTSGISLEDIQVKFNSQIELLYLTEADLVSSPSTFAIPNGISSARYIANRPFLPTSSLEAEIDFSINEADRTITFAKPLSNNGFIYRTQVDGTKKYAMWLVDVRLDNHLLYSEYASLLQIAEPESITEEFKNFVYGMYYLYVNGPNLDLIRKGLNIALGIPISRDNETILEIRKYLETDQYIIITTNNSYLLPYGLEASVVEGQEISIGTGLADWVELKDYLNDGDWWINLRLPAEIIPHTTTVEERYASPGSLVDSIMRNYLKTHTFLVNIKTTTTKNLQTFAELSDIIHTIKPSYVSPIYIWSVTAGGETLDIVDELNMPVADLSCIGIGDPIGRFVRDSDIPLTRSCYGYTRFSAPAWANDIVGRNPDLNGVSQVTGIGTLEGFINQNSAIRSNSEKENAWIRALRKKEGPYYYFPKSYLSRINNVSETGTGVGYNHLMNRYPGYRILLLYISMSAFIESLFIANDVYFPKNEFIFTLFEKEGTSYGINSMEINGEGETSNSPMIDSFSSYMIRNPLSDALIPGLPEDSYKTYTPLVEQIGPEDFLIFARNRGDLISVYWATKTTNFNTAPYYDHYPTDRFSMEVDGTTTKGLAVTNQPRYMMRAYPLEEVGYVSSEINAVGINESTNLDIDPILDVKYSDTQNTNVSLVRSGIALTFKRNWS